MHRIRNNLPAILGALVVCLALIITLGAHSNAVVLPPGFHAAPTVATVATPHSLNTAQSGCSPKPDGKCYWYNGYHFAPPYDNPHLCAQNNIGTWWNIPTAANAFESGTQTVTIENRNINNDPSCASSGYPNRLIFTLLTYNLADGFCSKVTGNNNNGQWTGSIVVWMNQHYPTCQDSTQRRNNEISNAIGTVLGLDQFISSSTLTAAVMNGFFRDSYNFAGGDDRTALYWLY